MQKHQKLPDSDEEFVQMWNLCGRNNKRTGEAYGVGESPVRKRLVRIYGPTQRKHYRLPKPVGELYAEWLATGTERGSQTRLARSYGVLPVTLRRAFAMYRERNSEEDEKREREQDQKARTVRQDTRRRSGVRHPRHQELYVPQHADGRPVR